MQPGEDPKVDDVLSEITNLLAAASPASRADPIRPASCRAAAVNRSP